MNYTKTQKLNVSILIFTLTVMFLLPQYSFAQFGVYTTGNSQLPNNFINVVKTDSKNNMWIGTQNGGLAKFTGTSWTVWNMSNSILSSNDIKSIEIVDTNEIWIGTISSFVPGLFKFDGTSFIKYDTINGVPLPMSIYALKKDSHGKLWIGSSYTYIFDGTTLTQLGFNDPRGAESFLEAGNVMWIGCNGNGLYKYENNVFTQYTTTNSGLPSNYASSLALDANGDLWMGGKYPQNALGLTKYDGTTWTNYNITNSAIPRNVINDIVIDDKGIIWLANGDGNTPGGLVRFDGTNFTLYSTANTNLSGIILDLHIDNLGRLLMGTYAGGLDIYDIPDCLADFTLHRDNSAATPTWYAVNKATGTGALSYKWYWGDGDSSTIAYPTHDYTWTGNYDICLKITDSTGCTNSYCYNNQGIYKAAPSATIIVVPQYPLPTGIENPDNGAFDIYPNPAQNFVTIATPHRSHEAVHFQIISSLGRVVMSSSVPEGTSRIAIGDFPAGIYFIRLHHAGAVAARAFVKAQ